MEHYFDNNPSSKSEDFIIKTNINKKDYIFHSDNGVFSKNKLDYGTKLLLENLPLVNIGGKVLDLGCGYGPIGIFLLKNTNSEVHMVDINNRALNLAKRNCIKNKVDAKIYQSDGYSNIKDKFDFIITNPPIRAGNKVLYKILLSAKDYLNTNGQLWLVVRKKQGAKKIFENLSEEYKTEIVKKSKGYYVIKAIMVD